ncbi:MAG: hypothetical protein EP343_26070 [Deltaproteobacteria bacterium]|nr:MAG: hypothetical protein EP343_26070 [Deltaproteobacteria bacterium]
MNVIFLDIDGVLNNDLCQRAGNESICPENVEQFNRIIRATKASIVLSSSWRLMIGRSNQYKTLSDLQRYLRIRGVQGTIIDTTPDLTMQNKVRGQEISKWLKEHPEVAEYIILDDVTDLFMPSQRTVSTDGMKGLTASDADRAIQLLSQHRYAPLSPVASPA